MQLKPIRLQKILAQSGIGSRRKCEELIESGRVSVNGSIVTELGSRAVASDRIEVDGIPILTEDKVVYALNKPLGMVCAMSDDHLPNLGDICTGLPQRVFHVGRLDSDSEGLLLLTNDGDMAQRISHPSQEISKTYQLEVEGTLKISTKKLLLTGISLKDGRISLDSIKIKATTTATSLIEVQIHSGKNRILRRMFSHVGHPVRRLIRTKIGHLSLGNLAPGEIRELQFQDIEKIFAG
jgi:23S rRNA pseudouridine2605 synthase